MSKTISSNEAKNRLGTWLGYVNDQDEEVVIESHGKPRAVIMSMAAFEEIQELREQKRRADALNELRSLRADVSARNQDLTPEHADELADRFAHEIVDDMADEGRITFERDRR